MSNVESITTDKNTFQKPLPVWLSTGVLGMALGSAVSIVVMHGFGYRWEKPISTPSTQGQGENPSNAAMPPGMGGMGGMGGGGGPMMGMGGMMGGGGAGGFGGGSGSRGKRNLTALVGKLELLSKGVRVELDAEQSAKIAAKLTELEQLETMTGEDAESHLNLLEEILSDEQKSALGAIDLPRGGRAGGGAGIPGAAGGGMAGGPMMRGPGGPPGGGGASGGSDDENPFRQEANQKQLRDLRSRLQPSGAKAEGTP